jgi:uncharacterized protein involved in outer membrane biogenesis
MAISKRKLIYPIFATLVFLGLMVIAVSYVQLKDIDALRDAVVEEILAETKRDVKIGSAQLDFTEGIGLLLSEVTLKGASAQESDFTCDKVLVLLHWLPLLKGKIKIHQLIFEGLKLQVTRNDQGAFNFGDLSAAGSSRSDDTVPHLIQAGLMHKVQVRKSELWLVDYLISSGSKPLVTKIKNLSFSLNKHFMKSLLWVHLDGDVPFTKQESGRVKLDGKIQVPEEGSDLSKVTLEGALQFKDVGTEPFQPYLAKVFEQHPGEHLVSLNTQFAGTLDGHIQLSGSLKHTQRAPALQSDLSKVSPPVQGSLTYNFIFSRDTVEFKQLDYRSEDFFLMINGTYARFLSDKAWLTVTLKSTPFKIQNSTKYLPLKVFSKDIHNRMHSFLKKGEVEVVSLNIEGPRAIFEEGRSNAEIQKYDSGLIILRHVDMGMDALPLQNVSGELSFKESVAKVTIQEARFEQVLIKNVSGTVIQPLTEPMIEGTLEAEGALAPMALLIEKKWTLPDRWTFLKELKRIKGVGHGKLSVRGPLYKNEQLMWSGNVSLERAGFIKKGWSAPIHNINGNIHFKSVTGPKGSAGKRMPEKTWALRFENFNGEFGNHYFRDINAESFIENGIPVKKVHGKIRLGVLKAEQVIDTPFEGRIKSFLKHVLLESGEIDFNFQNTGPGPGSKQSQNRGSLEIKKLYLKHSKGFRPLKNLNATVLFDDHNIDLKTAGGWYGDSPLELKGRFKNYSGADPELVLTARSTDFLRQDFAGIPFLETLEYQGPAKVDLKFHKTDQFIKLEKKVDLTRVSYRYKDFLIKPENVSNSIQLSATLDSEGKIDFKKVVFELEGSQVNGKGFLKSMDDPQFSIQFGSDHFKTWPASQYIRPLQGSLGGGARFYISAQGNFRNLEEAVLQGSVRLKGIEYKPDHFLVPIKFNADMKFKNKHFQIKNGKLEAKGSKIFFGGDYQGGEVPHVKLQLMGPGLDLNQLVSGEGKPSKGFLHWLSETHVFSKGSGEIKIKLNRFSQKLWTLPEVVGKFTFKDRVLRTNNLTLGQPKIDEVMITGELSLADIQNPSFDMVLISRSVLTDKLFAMFGGMFKASLTGNTVWLKAHLHGRGGNLKQITQSLKGRLSFNLKDGRINTGRLLNGVVDLFGISVNPKTVAKRKRQHDAGYLQIFGDFSILDGVARTENFLYEEKGERLSLVGAFDLNTSRMGTVVGVAPFRKMDRIIKKIPILGPIVTGGKEGSLITTYYKVDGPFSDPKVESVPFKSISEKILGTLEGIVIAPSELFSSQEPSTQ